MSVFVMIRPFGRALCCWILRRSIQPFRRERALYRKAITGEDGEERALNRPRIKA
jgi:hypothetical protein